MRQKVEYPVRLTHQERQALQAFVRCGHKKIREVNRAHILLNSDAGKKDREIMALLHLSRPTVIAMRKKYVQTPYEHILDILKDAPRSGRPIKIDHRVEANLTMIACSDPPEGAGSWTLRMLADQAVELACIESISHESVRGVFKKTV